MWQPKSGEQPLSEAIPKLEGFLQDIISRAMIYFSQKSDSVLGFGGIKSQFKNWDTSFATSGIVRDNKGITPLRLLLLQVLRCSDIEQQVTLLNQGIFNDENLFAHNEGRLCIAKEKPVTSMPKFGRETYHQDTFIIRLCELINLLMLYKQLAKELSTFYDRFLQAPELQWGEYPLFYQYNDEIYNDTYFELSPADTSSYIKERNRIVRQEGPSPKEIFQDLSLLRRYSDLLEERKRRLSQLAQKIQACKNFSDLERAGLFHPLELSRLKEAMAHQLERFLIGDTIGSIKKEFTLQLSALYQEASKVDNSFQQTVRALETAGQEITRVKGELSLLAFENQASKEQALFESLRTFLLERVAEGIAFSESSQTVLVALFQAKKTIDECSIKIASLTEQFKECSSLESCQQLQEQLEPLKYRFTSAKRVLLSLENNDGKLLQGLEPWVKPFKLGALKAVNQTYSNLAQSYNQLDALAKKTHQAILIANKVLQELQQKCLESPPLMLELSLAIKGRGASTLDFILQGFEAYMALDPSLQLSLKHKLCEFVKMKTKGLLSGGVEGQSVAPDQVSFKSAHDLGSEVVMLEQQYKEYAIGLRIEGSQWRDARQQLIFFSSMRNPFQKALNRAQGLLKSYAESKVDVHEYEKLEQLHSQFLQLHKEYSELYTKFTYIQEQVMPFLTRLMARPSMQTFPGVLQLRSILKSDSTPLYERYSSIQTLAHKMVLFCADKKRKADPGACFLAQMMQNFKAVDINKDYFSLQDAFERMKALENDIQDLSQFFIKTIGHKNFTQAQIFSKPNTTLTEISRVCASQEMDIFLKIASLKTLAEQGLSRHNRLELLGGEPLDKKGLAFLSLLKKLDITQIQAFKKATETEVFDKRSDLLPDPVGY